MTRSYSPGGRPWATSTVSGSPSSRRSHEPGPRPPGETSDAVTCRSGRSSRSASAIAPSRCPRRARARPRGGRARPPRAARSPAAAPARAGRSSARCCGSLPTEDVRRRLALVAAPDVLGDHAGGAGGSPCPGRGTALAAHTQCVGEQELRVQPRTPAASRLERGGRSVEGVPGCQLPTGSAASSIGASARLERRGELVARGETPGRLPLVSPTR